MRELHWLLREIGWSIREMHAPESSFRFRLESYRDSECISEVLETMSRYFWIDPTVGEAYQVMSRWYNGHETVAYGYTDETEMDGRLCAIILRRRLEGLK